MSSSELVLEVPGVVVSANRGRTFGNGRVYLSAEAREYRERVRSIAVARVAATRWKAPAYARVELYAYNQRIDAGNVEKVLVDALEGSAISNDRTVLELSVVKRWDEFGARVVARISEASPPSRPRRKRVRKVNA